MKYIKTMTSCNEKAFCGCTFEKCCCMFLQNVHPVTSLKMFLHATKHFWSFQTLGLSEDLSGLTKRRISSSSYCSSVYEWRPKLFWWPLWKCPPHSPGTLPNTRGRALHSSAAASPRPTITEYQLFLFFLDRLYVVVVSGLHASSRTDFYFHVYYMLSYLCVSDGSLIQGLELPRTLFILPEVSLAANQDDRNIPAEVSHLGEPLDQENSMFISLFFLFFLNIKFVVVPRSYSAALFLSSN